MKGMINARARAAALDEAFSSAFGSLLARTFKQEEAAAAVERQRAKERAEACETVWDAAREGVPVQTLRELMERNIDRSRRAARAHRFGLVGWVDSDASCVL